MIGSFFCDTSLHAATLSAAVFAGSTLAGLVLQLHLAESQSEAQCHRAGVELIGAVRIQVRTVVVAAPPVPVEDIVGVQEDGELLVEEVAAQTRIEAVVGDGGAEERHRRRAIITGHVDFQTFPEFRP